MTGFVALLVWSGALALLVGGGVLLGAHNERRAWLAALSVRPAEAPRSSRVPLPSAPASPPLSDAPIPGASEGFGPHRHATLRWPPPPSSGPPGPPSEP